MLLISDYQSQIPVYDLFLDQRVSSNDHLCLSGSNLLIDLPLLLLRTAALQQHRTGVCDLIFFQQAAQ